MTMDNAPPCDNYASALRKPTWQEINSARLAAIDDEIADLEFARKEHQDAAKLCTEQIAAKRHEREACEAYQYVGRPRAARRTGGDAQTPTLLDADE